VPRSAGPLERLLADREQRRRRDAPRERVRTLLSWDLVTDATAAAHRAVLAGVVHRALTSRHPVLGSLVTRNREGSCGSGLAQGQVAWPVVGQSRRMIMPLAFCPVE
jgi:hypothetical protein